MNNIDLSGLFNNLQAQMLAQLNTNREFILHSGSKGDSLENVWIEWLRKYLPNRYCVDKAIVVDCNGDLSHQLDLVIYDQQYTPFVFTQNGIYYIPAEGVYAVFEVKPDLQGKVGDDNFFEYAGKKVESVRKLKRTSVPIINAGKEVSARPLTKIIGGILSSTNSFTHSNNDTITSHLKNLMGLQTLELGCAADYGNFTVSYKGEEDLTQEDFHKRINDYYETREFEEVIFSEPDTSLVAFFLQLTRYLQQSIGTVAAIDLNSYAETMGVVIREKI